MADLYARESQRIEELNDLLARNWWTLALRGAVAVLLGVLSLLMPAATVATLALLLAVYLIVDGVFAILTGVRAARQRGPALPFILEGVASLIAGVLAAAWPEVTIFALVFIVAAWAVVTGFAEIMGAWRMHRSHGKWIWGLAGALSLLFGFTMWVLPALGILVLAWTVAAYLIAFGALGLVTALRLRRCHRDGGHGRPLPAG